MVFYLSRTKLEAKEILRAKSANLKMQWANMRHREKGGAKNASMKGQKGKRAKVQNKRFYSTRLYLMFNYIRIIIKDF